VRSGLEVRRQSQQPALLGVPLVLPDRHFFRCISVRLSNGRTYSRREAFARLRGWRVCSAVKREQPGVWRLTRIYHSDICLRRNAAAAVPASYLTRSQRIARPECRTSCASSCTQISPDRPLHCRIIAVFLIAFVAFCRRLPDFGLVCGCLPRLTR
jgi:hypothetical protein